MARKIWTAILSTLSAIGFALAGHFVYFVCDSKVRDRGLSLAVSVFFLCLALSFAVAILIAACFVAFKNKPLPKLIAAYASPLGGILLATALTVALTMSHLSKLDPRTAHVPDDILSGMNIESMYNKAHKSKDHQFCTRKKETGRSYYYSDSDHVLIDKIYGYNDSFILTTPKEVSDWETVVIYSVYPYHAMIYSTGVMEIEYNANALFSRDYSITYLFDASIYGDIYDTARQIIDSQPPQEEPVVTE